ncbi:MAG: phosphate ABC transporter permease PstA [Spirochaetia bacterium]|nr:phosphate ABC transporter permease PstA [Spirochaetia bacterium]
MDRFFSEFGSTEEAELLIDKRKRRGIIWKVLFLLGTLLAIVFLVLLIASIITSVFGYAALRNNMNPEELVPGKTSIEEFTREELEKSANNYLSSGILRRIEYEEPIVLRSDKDLRGVIEEYIIKPKILKTWDLTESLLKKAEIEQFVRENEGSYLIFKSWITPEFIVSEQSSDPWKAGIRTAVLGSLWIILITFLFSFPIGVGAAIYLQEYAKPNRLNRYLQLNIFNLSAVPSIIYGLLGLAVFVRFMEPITSGSYFIGQAGNTLNGRTIVSGGLTLGLLILPIIIINTQEALKAVPDTLRMSSYGIGATKWQTVWHQILPVSIDRILTGTILALSRALGETAPLVVIGASTFIAVDPSSIFSKFTTLPIQIYQWSARPQGAYRNIAAAAIISLLILLMLMNSTAIYLRNRVTKKKRLEK